MTANAGFASGTTRVGGVLVSNVSDFLKIEAAVFSGQNPFDVPSDSLVTLTL